MIYRFIEPVKKRLKLNKTSKINFFRYNKPIMLAALAYQFINMRIETDEQDEMEILSPTQDITYNPETDLDFYSYYSRIISTPTTIWTIFYKRDVKYSKQFVCYSILTFNNLVTELLARTRLRVINTTNMYHFVFKSLHNFDVELAVNDILENYGVVTPESLKRYIGSCSDVHTNQSK